MNSKTLVFLTTVFLLPLVSAQQVSVTKDFNTTSVDPATETNIGQYKISENLNSTVQLTDIVTNRIPFNVTYNPVSTKVNGSVNVSVNVSVPSGWQPQTYNGETTFLFENHSSITEKLNLSVNRVSNWNITSISFEDNVTVGESGKFGEVNFENSGNSPVELDVNATGNLTDYLRFDGETTVHQGENDYIVNYDIDRDVDFGSYKANFTFSKGNDTESIGVETRFIDSIGPSIVRFDFPSFQATKPGKFEIVATDNLEIESVEADIIYQDTVQQGNDTVEVNKTLETVEFDKSGDGNSWTGEMENNQRVDKYFVNGRVLDESGNKANFTDSFKISRLDVIDTRSNVQIPAYKFGSTVEERVGTIWEDTSLEIELETFNHNLDNWSLGIKTDAGKEFFDSEGDSIELDSAQEIDLFVGYDGVGDYRGELVYKPIDQHVDLSSTTFYGNFTNYTSPKDKQFEMLGKMYVCNGQSSDLLRDAKWVCQFNISAGNVPPGSDLKDEIQFAVPSEAKQDFEQRYQSEIQEAEEETDWEQNKSAFFLWLAVLSVGGATYTIRYYPKHYGVYLIVASRRKQAQEATKSLTSRISDFVGGWR